MAAKNADGICCCFASKNNAFNCKKCAPPHNIADDGVIPFPLQGPLRATPANSETWDGPLYGKGEGYVWLSSTSYAGELPSITQYPREKGNGDCFVRVWTDDVENLLSKNAYFFFRCHERTNGGKQRFVVAVPQEADVAKLVDLDKAEPISYDSIFNEYTKDLFFTTVAVCAKDLPFDAWKCDCVHNRNNFAKEGTETEIPDEHKKNSPIHTEHFGTPPEANLSPIKRFLYHVTSTRCVRCHPPKAAAKAGNDDDDDDSKNNKSNNNGDEEKIAKAKNKN